MEHKRISITLPEDILTDIAKLSAGENISRNSLIVSILKSYLAEKRRIENRNQLMEGYLATGDVNLSIAEEFFDSDQATQDAYEDYLTGCE